MFALRFYATRVSWILLCVAVLFLGFGMLSMVHAQEAADAVVATVAPVVTDVDVLKSVGKVATDWNNLGALGGGMALIKLLMQLMNYGPLDQVLELRGLKWTKGYVAIALGGIGGGLSASSMGVPVGPAVMAGVCAGLGSVGLHEFLNPRKPAPAPVPAPPAPLQAVAAAALTLVSHAHDPVAAQAEINRLKSELALALKAAPPGPTVP